MSLMGPGEYPAATVLSSRIGANKEKTDLVIEVRITEPYGDSITAFLHTTEAAWPYTEAKLKALGWDAEANGFDLKQLDGDTESKIAGNKIEGGITVEEETFEGKTRSRVTRIGDSNGVTRAELPFEEKERFVNQLRARLLSGKGPAPNARRAAAPKGPRAKAATEPAADDEVPW